MAKTNFNYLARKRRHVRVRKNVSGTLEQPRLNVFRSLNHIYAQVIDDTNGVTLAQASSLDTSIKSLTEKPSKTERAKMVGRLVAERALKVGVTKVVFDRGGYKYHGRVKALADSSRKNGLKF
ncbi:50S ribosomal protein L18 [Anaerolineales bacterium HSG24]|nr:50S ribosomal protein L18 [Anaerolineales bacterium HSG24]